MITLRPDTPRALARAISAIEDRRPGWENLLDRAYDCPQTAPVVGVTGPPGAGKSTLVDRLSLIWALRGERVALLTIDPSSPFSGGALLGDRIRMDHTAPNQSIFHRSLASRGEIGGLSAATSDIVALFNFAGFDRVVIETVGAGQADIEVRTTADCVLVVSVPGLGDQVQASKAGLMEIGDVYVVNKSDLSGAQSVAVQVERALDSAYHGRSGENSWSGNDGPVAETPSVGAQALFARHGDPFHEPRTWRPPVLPANTSDAAADKAIVAAVDAFLIWNGESGRAERRGRDRLESRFRRGVHDGLLGALELSGPQWTAALSDVLEGRQSPLGAAAQIVERLFGTSASKNRASRD